jgi:hypothetical protein
LLSPRPGRGAEPLIALNASLAKWYLMLVLVRAGCLVVLGAMCVLGLMFPGSPQVWFAIGVTATLLFGLAWAVGGVVGFVRGSGRERPAAAGQFTTLDLWDHAVQAAGYEETRWAKRRLVWTARVTLSLMAITVLLGLALGDWSISLR